jgi:hypothetical protein
MRLKITLICLALAALLAVGCGSSGSSGSNSGSGATESSSASTSGDTSTGDTSGGDSSSGGESTDSGVPPTKAEFIKQGEAICAKVPQEYTAAAEELEKETEKNKEPKPSKAETNAKAAVPPLFVAIESFEELTPPKGEEEQVEAIISSFQSAAEGLEKKPASEFTGPKSPFAEFQKLTEAYGLKGCSQL